MIRNPIDISSRVSPELSDLIESIINNFDTDEPITLAAVRSFIVNEMPGEIDEAEHMHHFDNAESSVDELDELIEQFGESAVAEDFISAFASEQLTRVIEEVVSDETREVAPSLADVMQAINEGLVGRMVGRGVLEEDEDDVVEPELEGLIERYGADAAAEGFLRYE